MKTDLLKNITLAFGTSACVLFGVSVDANAISVRQNTTEMAEADVLVGDEHGGSGGGGTPVPVPNGSLTWSCSFTGSSFGTKAWSGVSELKYCHEYGKWQLADCNIHGGGALLVDHVRDGTYDCSLQFNGRIALDPSGFLSIEPSDGNTSGFVLFASCYNYMTLVGGGSKLINMSPAAFMNNVPTKLKMDGGALDCSLEYHIPQ